MHLRQSWFFFFILLMWIITYIGLTLENQSTLHLGWPAILIDILVLSLNILRSRKPHQDSWSPYLHPLCKPNLVIMCILFYVGWLANIVFRIFASMFGEWDLFFLYTDLVQFCYKDYVNFSHELGNVPSFSSPGRICTV